MSWASKGFPQVEAGAVLVVGAGAELRRRRGEGFTCIAEDVRTGSELLGGGHVEAGV
jgi:hypothetical protein